LSNCRLRQTTGGEGARRDYLAQGGITVQINIDRGEQFDIAMGMNHTAPLDGFVIEPWQLYTRRSNFKKKRRILPVTLTLFQTTCWFPRLCTPARLHQHRGRIPVRLNVLASIMTLASTLTAGVVSAHHIAGFSR
jgi:hypothetical protein